MGRETARAQAPARARHVSLALIRPSPLQSALHARRENTRLTLAPRRVSTARRGRLRAQAPQGASLKAHLLGSTHASACHRAAGSRCSTTKNGGLYVMTLLMTPTPGWCVVRQVFLRTGRVTARLEAARGGSGWTM